jgi:hypothetical protein
MTILDAYMNEFSQQPYCGFTLFYLLFHEFSENIKLVEQTLQNVTTIDLHV